MKKTSFLIVFILACNVVVAQNYFIKFEGMDGESKNVNHRGWSDIQSFSQELEANLTGQSTGRRAAEPTGKNISIMKRIDRSSPKIMEALIKSKRIPKVEIEIATSRNDVIYRYELKNVVVTKYVVMGSEEDLPMEEIIIGFEEQKIIYTEYDNTGRSRGNVETEFN